MAKNYNFSSLQKLAFFKFAFKMLISVLILDIQSTQTQENIEKGDNPLSSKKETKEDQNILFSLTSFTDEKVETVEINEQLDTVYNEYFQESIINEEFMLMKFTIYCGNSVTKKNLQNVIITVENKLTSINDKKNIEINDLFEDDDEINKEFKKVIDGKIGIEITSNIKGINLLEIIKKENEKDKQKIDFKESLDDTFEFNKNFSAELKKPLQIFNIYCNQKENDLVFKKYLKNFFETIEMVRNGENFKFFNVTICHKINIETSKLTNPRCKTDIKFNTIVNISETDKKYYLCFVSAHGTFFMMKSHQSKFTGNFMELN